MNNIFRNSHTRISKLAVSQGQNVKMVHREFGNLTKVNKQVYYGLSSFEQRIFPYYFSKGIPNTFRRLRGQLFRVTPALSIGYLIYYFSTNEFDAANRKVAADFANDK